MPRRAIIAGIWAALAFAAGTASAQDSGALSEAEKARVLDTYNMRVSDDAKRVGDLTFGRLGNLGSATFEIEVSGRNSYQALADCGQVCYNIDLVVMNAAGVQIGADTASDKIPLVEIAPDGTGPRRLKVEVKMTGCDRPACPFVLGVYRID